MGCPIAPNVAGVSYYQYLGLFDALGQLNMWGNQPSEWVPTWHSTDPWLPPAMAAGDLTQRAARTAATDRAQRSGPESAG
jgi:hypothetical protein